jgi:glucosamine-6-phosphate deaminase
MKVIIVKDKKEMGIKAGEIMAAVMNSRPSPVIGLATGSTPLPLYERMIQLEKEGKLDMSTTISFNLDEYVGIAPDHHQSYRYFMDTNLFNHTKINKKNTHVPDGMADDPDCFVEEYEQMMEDVGGIDIQVLGIGSNGHIAFNEPGTSLASRTHVTGLTEQTIEDNARFFAKKSDVPTQAMTMGIGTILDAENIILLANGENKCDAVAKALEGPITSMCPASALQLHPRVTFIICKDATAKLKHFGK